jgi:nucleoside-diphosphate-sugar epimerase
MLSVLINTNLLLAAKKFNIKKYFFSSSACAYNTKLQENSFISGLKEEDAYPAYPEDGYGWEKLFSERMCRHFFEDFGLKTYVARYHNIYGPYGTYDGGREKSPAAICRKVIKCLNNQNTEIEIWGDGEQTRSFLYIDDCVEATLRLFESDFHDPINIGSEEQVSINQMTDMIFNFSKLTGVKKKYLSDKPKGVRGRSSNNDLIKEILNWNYNFSLNEGLKNTYDWILKDIQSSGSKSNFILP